MKILSTQQLRMAPFISTNDPREAKDWIFGLGSNNRFLGVSIEETLRLREEASKLAKATCKIICLTRDSPKGIRFDLNSIYYRGFCKPRMWAQYADHHSGVCLIFDKTKLGDAISNSIKKAALLFEGNVIYRNRSQARSLIGDPFTLDFDAIRNHGLRKTVRLHVERYWRELFFEKALDWADEQEYRWVLWDTEHDHHFFKYGDALKGILVGPDIDESYKELIKKHRRDYSFELRQINWKNGVPEMV